MDNETQDTPLEKYAGMIEVRALLQLIPFGIGSAIDSYAGNNAEKIKQDRVKLLLNSFAEDLSKLKEDSINKDYVSSEDFYLLFKKSVDASKNERSREKIKLFKNLLLNAVTSKNIDSDIIDIMADIVRDISYSEFLILSELYVSSNKSKSYLSFSSIDNELAPYFISQLRSKGLIEGNDQNILLANVASRLIGVVTRDAQS